MFWALSREALQEWGFRWSGAALQCRFNFFICNWSFEGFYFHSLILTLFFFLFFFQNLFDLAVTACPLPCLGGLSRHPHLLPHHPFCNDPLTFMGCPSFQRTLSALIRKQQTERGLNWKNKVKILLVKKIPDKHVACRKDWLTFIICCGSSDAGKDWRQEEKGTTEDEIDGWMASPTQWIWVWVNSVIWWWTGRPGMLQSMGSQRVGQDWVTELNWTVGLLIATDGSPKMQKTQVRSHRMSFKTVRLFLKVSAQSNGLSC